MRSKQVLVLFGSMVGLWFISMENTSVNAACPVVVPGNASAGVSFGNVVAGQTYSYQASGCITFQSGAGAHSSDPDGNQYFNTCTTFTGAAFAAPGGFLCPGLSAWSLVGKINGGSCIQLGSTGTFVAATSGTLTLYYNDDIFEDNSGSWNVCITPVAQACVTVPATAAGGVSFGNVVAGQTYSYQATGAVGFNFDGCQSDPDGNIVAGPCGPIMSADGSFTCPGLKGVSLVGKVNGTCIQMGSSGTFVAPSSGPLTLYYNDSIYGDNNGSWNVCFTPVQPPCIVNCPTNLVAYADASNCVALVNYPAPSTSGPCGPVSCSPPFGSFFPVGTTPVSCSVSNGPGCSFNVTVVDRTPPVPDMATLPTISGQCSATLTAPTATDNCAGTVTGTTLDPLVYNTQGTFTVHWTFSDGHGNTNTANQTVIVQDTTPPQITCPPDITTTIDGAACSVAMLNVGTASASDNCGTPTVGSTRSDGKGLGDPYPVGTTLITWTATDSAGNSTNCVQQVTVLNAKSITGNFNGTAIAKDNYLWFTAVASPVGTLPTNADFTVRFINPSVQFTAGGTNYSLAVPNGRIEFSASVSNNATTIFNGAEWVTIVPLHPSGNVLLTALAYQVPNDLPGGIKNVVFSGTFLSSVPGLRLNWKWAAAVYTSLSSNYVVLGVKPTDQSTTQYPNSDHAGTPELYRDSVTGGATGGGGGNYVGSLSGTLAVTPCLDASDPPSAMPEFRILSIQLEGDDVRVTWTAPGGCTNALQVMNGVLTGSTSTGFADMPEPLMVMAGSGIVTNSCVDVGGATNTPARFYRVRLVP